MKKSKKKSIQQYTLNDLFKGKDLEVIAAALLVMGKLRVDSVQLYRNSPAIQITLIGQYQTLNNSNNQSKANEMADFLAKNGNMTLDDVFEAISRRIQQKGGKT